ncbi:hypothetical protein A3F45_00705 [Candidatus Curtissbacteria bacterium RIFCSPHIGHO2_12_FULL_41_17]|uniref:GIY-YIG domain-containing protein n=2 Tax=Candidatus Curtissiibacteriota TaxID=1752717 RepID=A0A1F5HKL6_9BACT|nr:MAG: hypothetical protein A2693_04325 [Candidatus Curtissbacteria bacterium RIFCSPHIGHO2_01_FULL_40_12]OGE04690.1 MAG: hypothetical protein A3F45_00705 [Candidatus Curtissbacteria bacterium RIFCSPHIGHO2_12_FULL_41_17]
MFVYVLKSIRHGRFYTGLTEDVDRRFTEHNNGWVSKTKFYKPFRLVYVEIVSDRVEARKLEKYFKSGRGREIIKEIESLVI